MWKTQKRVRSSSKKEYKYVPLWCHEIPEARTSWAGVLRSSFLLKTLSHCSAFCPIWNQLNSILDLDQLLKLVHSHKALSCSNTSWWLVPCWNAKIVTFLHFKSFLNVHGQNALSCSNTSWWLMPFWSAKIIECF